MVVDIKTIVQAIVHDAKRLILEHTDAGDVPVNYACIFAHSDEEYAALENAAKAMGTVVQETKMGNIYLISPIGTDAGMLKLLKIRQPDVDRPERGYADFTLGGRYTAFKNQNGGKPGFSLITRPEMEIIEFLYPAADVRVYFASPTLPEVLKII